MDNKGDDNVTDRMIPKRFTDIEHDYENAWIKCNDGGDFMIYAIYKELDESLPSLEDLLNGLNDENQELKEFKRKVAKELQEYKDYALNTTMTRMAIELAETFGIDLK